MKGNFPGISSNFMPSMSAGVYSGFTDRPYYYTKLTACGVVCMLRGMLCVVCAYVRVSCASAVVV